MIKLMCPVQLKLPAMLVLPLIATMATFLFDAWTGASASPMTSSNLRSLNVTWPLKRVSEMEGDVILGGLMMVHEREDNITCGPIMPQGGIQVSHFQW